MTLTRRSVLAWPLLAGACSSFVEAPRQRAATLNLPGRRRPVRSWLALPRGYHPAYEHPGLVPWLVAQRRS